MKEFKTQCECNATGFEADLGGLYTEVRRSMTIVYPEDVGPASVSEPGKDIKDIDASEYEEYRKELEAQKAKIGSVGQDYCNAVSKGTRSSSGKIVQDITSSYLQIYGLDHHLPCRYLVVLMEIRCHQTLAMNRRM